MSHEITSTPRKRVTHRAALAPDKMLQDLTVGDFRQFVVDCDAQGITDDAIVFRERSTVFGAEGGCLIAERHTSLD